MPALDAIQRTDLSVTAGGRQYRIFRTIEVDTYESTSTAKALRRVLTGTLAPGAGAIAAALKARVPPGDQFTGKARKAAKLSIGRGAVTPFTDLKALIDSLPIDDDMIHHQPPIKTSPTSKRVKEEELNVQITTFLYAASQEADNDFHLIIGRDVTQTPEMYMTAEVSGLPAATSPAFGPLSAARNSYKTTFAGKLPLLSYDFYDPPIPVTLSGSVFFDMTHAIGQRPGPPSLKSRMPTIWEVHPITAITFG
jgi:hypothetical protein